MASVKDHYDNVLSDVYTWFIGGFNEAKNRNRDFFEKHNIQPGGSARAIDLGAGSGVQSIPLAELGFTVTAIDLSSKLLEEMGQHRDELNITIIEADILDFRLHHSQSAELVVCMTDTLLHLESKDEVTELFAKVFESLDSDGKFILTFRDLSYELQDLERFIPLKNCDDTIFSCFLEYESDTVKVHDLVYRKNNNDWTLNKSYYRKIRLSQQWVENQLKEAGFHVIESNTNNGFVTLIVSK